LLATDLPCCSKPACMETHCSRRAGSVEFRFRRRYRASFAGDASKAARFVSYESRIAVPGNPSVERYRDPFGAGKTGDGSSQRHEGSMELIDTVAVRYQGNERQVMLFVGDLARIPEREAVDLLVVSAFPDNYVPTRTSLIGALARAGVSVFDLALDKEVDLRSFSSCWLSRAIERSGIHFRRVLCFEPGYRGRAPEVVGDIFRSVVPFTTGKPPI